MIIQFHIFDCNVFIAADVEVARGGVFLLKLRLPETFKVDGVDEHGPRVGADDTCIRDDIIINNTRKA